MERMEWPGTEEWIRHGRAGGLVFYLFFKTKFINKTYSISICPPHSGHEGVTLTYVLGPHYCANKVGVFRVHNCLVEPL
jgi:hypothetical protein